MATRLFLDTGGLLAELVDAGALGELVGAWRWRRTSTVTATRTSRSATGDSQAETAAPDGRTSGAC